MYLPTIWTVVHPIDEKSPLYKYSDTEIENLDAFLYILIGYHEESFAQQVYQIYSYDFDHLETNVKYASAASFDEDGYTVLDHEQLSEIEKLE